MHLATLHPVDGNFRFRELREEAIQNAYVGSIYTAGGFHPLDGNSRGLRKEAI